MTHDLKELSIRYEHFETPEWAARAILDNELITDIVYDPCCGAGVLSEAAKMRGATVFSLDIHDWGYPKTRTFDWFDPALDNWDFSGKTCFMNPPFSLATRFVGKAIERKFRKIICFQRFAWYESQVRREFWETHPPSRVYICGDRAACWRHDIPAEGRGSSTPTAHGWFVWDRDAMPGTSLGRIYKEAA